MNKQWVQKKIRQNTLIMINQLEAYDKLPTSKTKQEIGKAAMLTLAQVNAFKDQLDLFDCFYGFAPDCPQCHCEDCYAVKKVLNVR